MELTARRKKKAEELPEGQTGTVAGAATTKVAMATTGPAEEEEAAAWRALAPTIEEDAVEAEEGRADGEYGGTSAADAVTEAHECAQEGSDTPAGRLEAAREEAESPEDRRTADDRPWGERRGCRQDERAQPTEGEKGTIAQAGEERAETKAGDGEEEGGEGPSWAES
ncbi:unnamed protein product [Closterium sp. NIES-65]|nr:unnamed protein product [Closterium sp. NIES-65]